MTWLRFLGAPLSDIRPADFMLYGHFAGKRDTVLIRILLLGRLLAITWITRTKGGVQMIRIIFLSLLSLTLLGAACQPAEIEPAATASTEADVEALSSLVRQYDAAVNSGNWDDYLAFYADDAVIMAPEQPVVIGKEAIRTWTETGFAEDDSQLSSTVEDVRVSGDWAFQRLSYQQSSTPKEGGDTTTGVGKWVIIWQRQADGSWRISTEIWNTDAPAPETGAQENP